MKGFANEDSGIKLIIICFENYSPVRSNANTLLRRAYADIAITTCSLFNCSISLVRVNGFLGLFLFCL